MLKSEMEYLNSPPVLPRTVSAEELTDGSDHTLLYGYTTARSTWHVYLQAGMIHVLVTNYPNSLVSHEVMHEGPVDAFIPNKRVYPQYSDFEFCRILTEKGGKITFTTYPDYLDSVDRGYSPFMGMIAP